MSIFPKKCVPGGQIVFHVRYPGPRDVGVRRDDVPLYGEIKLTVFDPDGNPQTLNRFLPTLVPQPNMTAPPVDSSKLIRKKTPLMFVASALQGKGKSSSELVNLLNGIGNSTHYYTHYTVASDAQPGIYRTLLETWIRGVRREKWNEFRVEWLEVKDVLVNEDDCTITVYNPSRESIVARIIPFDRKKKISQVVEFEPLSETSLRVESLPATLLYAEDAQSIPLTENGDCLVYVNPKRPSLENKESGRIDVLGVSIDDVGHELNDAAARIWRALELPQSRKKIRAINPAIYDEMIGAGLIFEIASNTNLKGIPDSFRET